VRSVCSVGVLMCLAFAHRRVQLHALAKEYGMVELSKTCLLLCQVNMWLNQEAM